MVKKQEVLAIVLARGGSKGIPRKNIALLGGHPLIAYSIVSGLTAAAVTRLIVSTDDDEIASVSQTYGAEVPFRRPAKLATDDALDFPVIEHALRWLEKNEVYRPKLVVQLRPTTPFRPRGLVDDAVRLILSDKRADSVRGVTKPSQNPYKMWREDSKRNLKPIIESKLVEPFNTPRQKLPQTLWQTGHIDVIRYETIIKQRSLTGRRVKPIIVDSRYCVDIDQPRDLEYANWMLQRGDLAIDLPKTDGKPRRSRPLPAKIGLVVFDFDGVFTDNRVYVTDEGHESVACSRSDGMGIALLKQARIEAIVLSTETNPVVSVRCRKLGIPCQQSLTDKATAMRQLLAERRIDPANVLYMGNDVNDLACMELAGCSIAVSDAHPSVLAKADIVLKNSGGHGAVRELCDIVLRKSKSGTQSDTEKTQSRTERF